MKLATEKLLMQRLGEIMGDKELAEFTDTFQFAAIWYAAENGRPFLLTKIKNELVMAV